MLIVERSTAVSADVGSAWAVISDMAAYATHVSGLATTTITAGAELGARRRCVDTSGSSWEETCVSWIPESRLTVEVDVSTYPAKFRSLFSAFRGTWWVEAADGGSVIGIRFEARLRPLGRPLRNQIERKIEGDLDQILASYKRSIAA